MEKIKIDKTENKSILVFSRDEKFKSVFKENLLLRNFKIFQVELESQLISLLDKESVSIIFFDIEDVLETEMNMVYFMKSRSPNTEIVVVSNIEKLDSATGALRNGAAFYLIKPFDPSNLGVVLSKLTLKIEQQEQYMQLEKNMLQDLMSGSPAMQKVLDICFKIAPTSSTIIIDGESGTGKEFFARIIHRLSKRTDGPFVAVNCGAMPENLFESEMFGHKKGSFTGADRDKTGLVEEANLGTLFLDEVTELSQAAQVKLLRFLQDKSIRRVGDTITKAINVRVIAATNKNISKLVEDKKFREDLFYRLNVFHIYLPPLRERKENIPYLIKMFIHKNNLLMDKHINKISKEAEVMLAGYNYAGNIRELENIIEHAAALSEGEEITASNLPESIRLNRPQLAAPLETDDKDRVLTLEEIEKKHIAYVLSISNSSYAETAKKLGLSRSTLWRKLKLYGMEK